MFKEGHDIVSQIVAIYVNKARAVSMYEDKVDVSRDKAVDKATIVEEFNCEANNANNKELAIPNKGTLGL